MTEETDAQSQASYPKLTIDTLAFAIATDILFDSNNHDEFDVDSGDWDQLAQAIYDDIRDLIHNGNQDDWLLCFYHNDGGTDNYEKVSKDLQVALQMNYDQESGMDRTDYGRHAAALEEVAEKAASIILCTRNGIPGRFGGFATVQE